MPWISTVVTVNCFDNKIQYKTCTYQFDVIVYIFGKIQYKTGTYQYDALQ